MTTSDGKAQQIKPGPQPMDQKVLGSVVAILAFSASAFHLYTAYFGSLAIINQRAVHLFFMAGLVFLANGFSRGKPLNLADKIAGPLVTLALGAAMVYLIWDYEAVVYRMSTPDAWDQILGALVVLAVLESCRRTIGWIMPALALAFLLYGYFGPYMPGPFAHRGYDISRIISHMYMGTEGVFGIPLGVSSTFIILFVIFGAFLNEAGGGEFFLKLGNALAGRTLGGPAKTAVVASSLMGSISGSAVANVVTTGNFTIPLMRRSGYRPHVAGAIEACASTGGQIMPPVMGAAAFVMAELTDTPYILICKSALIPSLLFYLSLFLIVHLEARREGLKPLAKDEVPSLKETLVQSGHLLVPLVGLVLMLIVGFSAMKSAFLAILMMVAVSWLRPHTRLTPMRIYRAMVAGARGSAVVGVTCACAGIIVGIVTLTGLGLKLSAMVISASGGILVVGLALTMLAALVLGMGLPTTPAYIILAILGVPALLEMGVAKIPAHMFIFYYGCFSLLTPPVCVASYAAAGLAEADAMRTGVTAFRFSLVAFIIPFMFVLSPELLWQGSFVSMLFPLLTALVGVFAFVSGIQGYFKGPLPLIPRILVFLAGLSLIKPGIWTDSLGVGLILISLAWQRFRPAAGSEKASGI